MNYGITDILTLLGSLGLFLYGMKVMSDALMEVAGDKMRNILATMTSNRVFGVFTGFLITSLIQSSSATTLMVVSFVNASLLTLTESVSVIMGANIGTTITAWLITILGFKVSMSALALPLVGLGFLLTFAKGKTTRDWGKFVIGFAILFIGLQFLKDSVPDINQNPEILAWLQSYTDLGFLSILLFLFLGTVLTVVLQSSSATMALTLVMCFEGWIPFDLAVAMVLGENIGTTITANLAALVANYNAKRTARAHFIFNMIGVVWMLILLYPFLSAVDWFVTSQGGGSPFSSPEAIPIALSVFHTSFNIINTTLLIFFIPLIVKLVVRLIPAVVKEEPGVDMPKYLDETSLKYPQTAMRALLDESKRLLEGPTFKIVSHALNLHRTDIKSEEKIKKIVKGSKETIEIDIDDIYYNKVKTIYSKIIKYATITQSEFQLKPKKVVAINKLKLANRYMVEVIKDCKGLQANVAEYMNSDNKYIQKEYDMLRRKVSKVLRKVYLIGTTKDPQKHQKALEDLKIDAMESDVMIDGTLDELIRKGHIDSEMATSLANDSDNVASISKHLIEVAELLYVESDPLLVDLPKKKKGKSKKKDK
ncbi:MAG: Na/Pi cotransporter family protein [Saprospiraceae bacterium]|nr:Na/Pi cotransporter family protein [Saprospiraceae bacterium]